MDVVRFGRALGFGARQAVKTVTAAVDAATAENPSRKSASVPTTVRPLNSSPTPPRPPQASDAVEAASVAAQKITGKAAHRAAQTIIQAREAKQRFRTGGRRFGGTAWKTFTRLGGVLWLEVSGVFFGIFALFALGGVWRLRDQWRASLSDPAGHRQLLGAMAMLAVFGYFSVSNFVSARRRERQR